MWVASATAWARRSVTSASWPPHGAVARLLSPWGLSRQKYWSGHRFLLQEDLPAPRTEPASLMPPALAEELSITSTTGKPQAR